MNSNPSETKLIDNNSIRVELINFTSSIEDSFKDDIFLSKIVSKIDWKSDKTRIDNVKKKAYLTFRDFNSKSFKKNEVSDIKNILKIFRVSEEEMWITIMKPTLKSSNIGFSGKIELFLSICSGLGNDYGGQSNNFLQLIEFRNKAAHSNLEFNLIDIKDVKKNLDLCKEFWNTTFSYIMKDDLNKTSAS